MNQRRDGNNKSAAVAAMVGIIFLAVCPIVVMPHLGGNAFWQVPLLIAVAYGVLLLVRRRKSQGHLKEDISQQAHAGDEMATRFGPPTRGHWEDE